MARGTLKSGYHSYRHVYYTQLHSGAQNAIYSCSTQDSILR